MKQHVLCIDDDKSFLGTLKKHLQDHYDVSIASDLKQAYQLLNKNTVDLALLDLSLDGVCSLDHIQDILQLDHSLPIIILSGHNEPSLIVKSIKKGASDYLCKASILDELIPIIEKNLAKRVFVEKKEALIAHLNILPKETKIIGESKAFRNVLEKAKMLKGYNANVLIEGESGTGKEILMKYIHSQEGGNDRPLIDFNCAAIPENLIEAELFGYEKGSFTGAHKRKIGKFELANGGDIFLDEINSLKLSFQAKLLRFLQEKKFYRIGNNQPINIDFRVIAATNKDLTEEARKGNFRLDLLYRLNVVSIKIPALRDRMEDIELLAHYFLNKHCKIDNRKQITPEVIEELKKYHWPGNIRELENVIQSMIIMSRNGLIDVNNLPDWFYDSVYLRHKEKQKQKYDPMLYIDTKRPLKEFLEAQEKYFVKKLLRINNGNISKTCHDLKISRTRLYRKIDKADLDKLN